MDSGREPSNPGNDNMDDNLIDHIDVVAIFCINHRQCSWLWLCKQNCVNLFKIYDKHTKNAVQSHEGSALGEFAAFYCVNYQASTNCTCTEVDELVIQKLPGANKNNIWNINI